MTGKQFEYQCRDFGGVPITDDYTLWPKGAGRKVKGKPVCVSDSRTDAEGVHFADIQEALDFVLDDGRKIRDIVETWTAMPEMPLDADIVWHTK